MTDDATRRAILLADLDLDRQLGIEFGALDRPLVPPSSRVRYVDHLDTAGLQHKYAGHDHVDPDRIVSVDVVLDGRPLVELLAGERIDYVIASHVAEHVPDLVGWLTDLRTLLAPHGTIRLALPDLRFTFDLARRPTALAEVVAAWAVRADRPQPHQVLEAQLLLQQVDAGEAWRTPFTPVEPDRDALRRATDLARAVAEHGTYQDGHCWTFTPWSFADLMRQLVVLELTDLGCERLEHTRPGQLEFFVILRPMGADEARSSWVAALATVEAIDATLPPHVRTASGRESSSGGEAALAALQAQVTDLQAQLDAVHTSRAWRVFEPYRRARRAIARTSRGARPV